MTSQPTQDELSVKRDLQLLKSDDGEYVLSTLSSVSALPKLVEYLLQQLNAARISELENAHMISHFTSLSGSQGECWPQEYINERIAQLQREGGQV